MRCFLINLQKIMKDMKVLEKGNKNEIELKKVSFGRAMQKRLEKQIERVQNDSSFDSLIEQLRTQKCLSLTFL